MSTFSERLKSALDQQQMKASELSLRTGIGKSSISQYMSDKNTPKLKTMRVIADTLGVTVQWLSGIDKDEPEGDNLPQGCRNIPVGEAAKQMGVSPQFIRIGLQRGILPFGCAVNQTGNRFTYWISPIKFAEYIRSEVRLS